MKKYKYYIIGILIILITIVVIVIYLNSKNPSEADIFADGCMTILQEISKLR